MILSKAPCNEDYFEGKAHEKLAKVIAEGLACDSDCTIIGIDGGWGTGKSNLVSLVEKILTKDESYKESHGEFHFFTFDAWGHQNDLPRRSILEELTLDLTMGENAILNEKEWKTRLENLLAKRKKTSTKIVPRINFAIVIIALVVALTPIISTITDAISTICGKLIFTGLFYTAAILFVVIKQWKNMKQNGQTIDCESFFSELFLLYKDKIKADEKYETISEREPSSRQFKEWMIDIDNDLKSKNKNLVIVIDNMDRLPKLKVQELWSAINSFFSEKHYDNIKVIVPFDRLHIRNAFQSEDIKDKKEIAVYGDDFINKTFYIVYYVAPPILSGWKQYFEYQWKEAFGDDVAVDNSVLQVYDLLVKEHTPRKIVAFINEFVTIKKIADKNIPDKYIALFIFGRSTISQQPMKEILEPSYLSALDFLYMDDKDMPGYISSLYYQLPVDDAVDVVYTRQFTRELDENAPDIILKMKVAKNNKFAAILEHAIAGVTNTINATMAFQFVFKNEDDGVTQQLWECLYKKDRIVRGGIQNYLPYQKVLLSHINNKSEYLEDLIHGYYHSFTDETNVDDYILGIDELATVKGVDLYSMLEKTKKEVSPQQFITLVEKECENYKRYGLFATDTALSEYLKTLEMKDLGALSILSSLNRSEYPLVSFKEKIEGELRRNNLKIADAKILFSRLKELRNGDLINYKYYFQNNILDSLFRSSTDEFKYDIIAMRLSALMKYSSPDNTLNNTLSMTKEDLISGVAKVCNNYVNYGSLLVAIDTFNYPLVKRVCEYLTVNKTDAQYMDVKSVAKKFEIITSNSNITKDDLLYRMNDFATYKSSIKSEDIPTLPLALFETAKEHDCELSAYLLELADNYLQSISQEDWTTYLASKDSFQLMLLELLHTTELQPFFDAFKSMMKKYARGEVQDCLDKEFVEMLINLSKSLHHDVNRMFMDIRDIFLTSSITSEKLKYFGDWLFLYANMEDKRDCLDKIFPSELLDDDVVIVMMKKHKEVLKKMTEHSNEFSEFKSKLKSMVLGNRNKNQDLMELCSYIGIDLESSSSE